jgi:hypothetical protein
MDKAKRIPKRKAETAEKSDGVSKPVSFHPLTFDESLDALLSVAPPPKDEPQEAKKRAAKKNR